MTAVTLLWIVLGTAAGVAQAAMLWWEIDRRAWTVAPMRLALIGAVLIGAALAGHLIAAAAGWFCAFAATACAIFARRCP